MKFNTSAILVISLVMTSVILTACGSPSEMTEGGIVEINPEYAEIDQRAMQFLNSEGSFTDEALAELPHMGYGDDLMPGNYLGIMYTQTITSDGQILRDSMIWDGIGTQIHFQGVFIGAAMDEDEMVMLFGMMDKNHNRVIIPFGRQIYPEDGNVPANISNICRFGGSSRNVATAGYDNLYLYPEDFNELQRMIGFAALISCSPQEFGGALKESFSGYGTRTDEKLEAISQTVPMCRKLYNTIVDVRGEGGALVDGADSSYAIFDGNTYPGMNSIVENSEPNLYYIMTIFVTQ